jgi:polyribonucleotide nucleotidyltransferase
MATVCAGTLAMLDAGVPLRASVAGIAMGLIKHGGEIAVLTDILGDEDHLGDMDFKVCGTRAGVTALQMDIKIDGLDESVLRRALAQAKDARLHILDHMATVMGKPRSSPKDNAPAALVTRIEPNRIGELIGPGGKNIKEIQASTQTTVNIEDGGRVVVYGANRAAAEAGVARIRAMFREPVVGEIIEATIRNAIEQFAFVELFPGTEAAIHVSEWAEGRIASLKEVAVPGETVRVKVLGVDKRGRIAASRKAALSQ